VKRPPGGLGIVLHAHLPFVRHPEQQSFLEEDWLHHAITECYAPLLDTFERLAADGVPFGVTMSLSPTLCAMLDDDLLRTRFSERLERLMALANRAAGALAPHYAERLGRVRDVWHAHQGDLLAGFARIESQGHLDLWAVPATHAVLPLLPTSESRRAQIRIGIESHRRHFAKTPRGMWLPECAWDETLDATLAECGVRNVVLEAHALAGAWPRPRHGLAAPIRTPAGIAAFGRDPESSVRVWSASEGYPGDPAYREFHRDVGWDADQETVEPFLSDDGHRRPVGLKLHRVTGPVPLSGKSSYDPEAANRRAVEHARDFLGGRARLLRRLGQRMDRSPIVVAAFDAELFGHWWYEGPVFLDALFRLAARSPAIETISLSDHVDAHGPDEQSSPAPSTWGKGADLRTWLHEGTAWMLDPAHQAEARMLRLAARPPAGALGRRALAQAGRELLLSQSSDWAFLITAGPSRSYAEHRFREHIAAFSNLCDAIEYSHIDEPHLASLESRNNLFPWLDPESWTSAAPQPDCCS